MDTDTAQTRRSESQEILDYGVPSDLLTAALAYAEHGWHVFPLQTNGKIPLATEDLSVDGQGKEGGFKVATTDEITIRTWWTKWPRANIGIATGASYLAVVDMDVKEGKPGRTSWAALMEEIGPENSATLCAMTPTGGQHFYYAAGGYEIPSSADKLAPGLDMRSRGGYVVAPPSRIGSTEYTWYNAGADVLPLPAAIAQRLVKPVVAMAAPTGGNGKGNAEYWLQRALTQAQVGKRNEIGFTLACQLRDDGVPKAEAEATMLRYAAGVPTGSSTYEASEALKSLESAYAQPARDPATSPAGKKKKHLQPEDYMDALTRLGYHFRLNEVGEVIEVNDMRLDDFRLAEIRLRMCGCGFTHISGIEDAVRVAASKNRYHPIRDYLISAGKAWSGEQHITALADHFSDITTPHPLFAMWLRKWLVGAVAKAFDGEHNQNSMLVLDGPQGIGKSHFAQWLCEGLPLYFLESAINPDDKDAWWRLASKWVWEVGELGATTRRADVEALKAFVSERRVTVRRPYGKLDTSLPALASLIGTINDTGGFLADPTGNRRFLVAKIAKINWEYTKLEPTQIWGEAFMAYMNGEDWRPNAIERALSEENNEGYKVPNPMESYLLRYFDIDAESVDNWMSTGAIVERLQSMGYRDSGSRALAMQVSSTLGAMGLSKTREIVNGGKVMGYVGIKPTASQAKNDLFGG